MSDPITPAATPPADPNLPNNQPQPGTDPKPTDEPGKGFDPASISDEEFEKVFNDQRLFKHSRFKELNEAAKEAKALKEAQAKAEEEKMKEQGKYKELLDKKEAELAELRESVTGSRIDAKLTGLLAQQGVVDAEAALKLIDRSKIAVGDDGSVSGAEDAVNALKEGKGYLFSKQPARVGGGTNPSPSGDAGGAKTFYQSQFNDSKFYQANKEDILKAWAAGTIVNDLTPGYGNKV